MSEKDEKKKDEKNPVTGTTVASHEKATVSTLFKKSKTKPYMLQAFCIYAKLQPESEISETDFNRKLNEFLNLRLG